MHESVPSLDCRCPLDIYTMHVGSVQEEKLSRILDPLQSMLVSEKKESVFVSQLVY